MLTIKWVPLVNHVNLRCCSCSLRTATMLIAWLGLMVMIIQVMDAACRLYYYREDFAFAILHAVVEGANADVKKPNDIDQSEGTPGAIDEGELSLGGGSSEDDEGIVSDDNVKSTYAYLIVSREALAVRLFFGLLFLLVYGCLLYGAWMEKAVFLLPYVLVGFCGIIILATIVVVGGIILIFNSPYEGFLSLIVAAPLTLLLAYLWAAVYTYYRQLTEVDVPQEDTQLQNLPYVKSEEEEIINPEEMQEAYEKIEYNIQRKQPYAV